MTAVDLLSRFENSTNGTALTTTILGNGTLGGIATGSWSLLETASTNFKVDTASEINVSGLAVSGVGGSDSAGTRGISVWNQITGRRGGKYGFLSNFQSKVSFGCAIKLDSQLVVGSDFSYDFFCMEGTFGEFFCLNYGDSGGGAKWNAHTQAGKSTGTSVVANHWYWITMLWDKPNNLATLKTYDLENSLALLGTETIALQTDDCYSVCLGRYDGLSGSSAAGWTHFDDLAIDFTGNTYPLLPNPDFDVSVTTLNATTLRVG